MANDLIPINEKGKPTDLKTSVTLTSVGEARHRYMKAVKRMLNPDSWHKLAEWAGASFKLLDMGGGEVIRLAGEGDYIRIDIPGPGPASVEGMIG